MRQREREREREREKEKGDKYEKMAAAKITFNLTVNTAMPWKQGRKNECKKTNANNSGHLHFMCKMQQIKKN